MPDYGSRFADRKIKKIDRQLRVIYNQAEKELQRKLEDFVRASARRDQDKRALVQAGLMTKDQYRDWRAGQIFQQRQWQDKVKAVQRVMYSHNVQAAKIVHENKMSVFAENYNHAAFQGEMTTGISFNVVNTQTIAALIKDRPQLLPEWKIDQPKDYSWNYRKVNNAITEGIIQGESIDQIADRIVKKLSTQNENKMRMFARTAVTQAQNAGRLAQMEDAADMGIKIEKQWLATLDSRTRHWHRDRDGETVPYNEEFTGGLEYPGDPAGDPADVYNCRCTMISIYPEYRDISHQTRVRMAYGEYEDEEGIHRFSYLTQDPEAYQKWKAGKIERGQVVKQQPAVQQHEPEPEPEKGIAGIKQIVSRHTGEWTPDELIDLGDRFVQTVNEDNEIVRMRNELDDITAQKDNLMQELAKIRKQIQDLDFAKRFDEADVLEKKMHEIRHSNQVLLNRQFVLEGDLKDRTAQAIRDNLSRVRNVGGVTTGNVNKYADLTVYTKSKNKLRERTIEALNHYPSEWLEKSSKMQATLCPHWTTGRAYYSHGFYRSEIRFADRLRTNVHELGHRFERAVPAIRDAEEAFYRRRTAGQALEWLGPGYAKTEVTRRDHFANPYMGKDYGGTAYELVSMGFENTFTNYDYFSKADPEMSKWILGILCGL